jgi:hypothetical protein
MFYKPLPVDARVTLEQQSQILGSTTKNSSKSEDFLIEYLEPRTSANIDDLSALFKKVLPIQNICVISFLFQYKNVSCYFRTYP